MVYIKKRFFLNIRIVILVVCTAIVLFCCQDKLTPLDVFFKDFKKKVGRITLLEFKSAEKDSLRRMFYLLEHDALEVLQLNSELDSLLESNEIYDDRAKSFVLLILCYENLNDKKVEFDKIIEEAKTNRMIYDKAMKKNEKCDQERLETAQRNLHNCRIGDTLDLTFPVYLTGQSKNAFYYFCPSAYETDTSKLLGLKGILIEKDTIIYYDGSTSWNFDLKVLEMSDTNTSILHQRVKINDTINVDLKDYGRFIGR